MKRIWKRTAAYILTVCLLASLIPATVATAVSTAIPTGSTVYDLDQGKGTTSVLDKIDALNISYAGGTSNWGWAGHDVANEDAMAFKSNALYVYAKEPEWIALKIKSPGEGLHTVGLNHSVSINSGICAAYILPADTADISKAMAVDNLVGKVSLTNMESSDMTAGQQSYFGTWEFGTDEEYILVLEMYKSSPYNDSRAYLVVSQIFMTPGDHMVETPRQELASGVTVDPGPIKHLEGSYYGTTTQVNGADYLFMPIEGRTILVFDLDNNVLVDEVRMPHSIARGMVTDPDGVVWSVGESRYLFRYDPYTRIGETVLDMADIIEGAQDGLYLQYAQGCLYFGIFPNGVIGKYEIETGAYSYYGPFNDDCNSVSAILYQDGYLYAGITGDKDGDGSFTSQIVKVNAQTGEMEDYLDLSAKLDENHKQFNGVALVGDLLLVGGNSGQSFITAVDVTTMELVDLGFNTSIMWDITEEVDGKVYFLLSGLGVYAMDVSTQAIAPVSGFTGTAPKPLRCGKQSIVQIDDPAYPGESIITYYTATGAPLLYNLQTGKTKSYVSLIESGYGSAVQARPIANGAPGSNALYIGAFNTPKCAVYNTETGEISNFNANSAQTDAFVVYGGVLYTGNYNDGSITRINIGGTNEVLLSMREGYNQARVHTLTAGDGKVFAGTTPYSGYGGCLAWVDVTTGASYVERNVVQDQSVNCIVYHDGLIYGTTEAGGGSGAADRDDLSAKLFVYDVAAKQKVAEFDLRNYLEGFAENIDYIAGIAVDPNGKFWGMVSQTLFSFTYNKTAKTLAVTEELSFGKDAYTTGGGKGSFPRPFCFDGKGNLYVAFDDAGGMRRINMEDPTDNERLPVGTLVYYTLGEDGNLYYTWGTALCMYPLNVTQEDWATAAAVDEKILAVGNKITLENAEQINDARAAYEALSLKDKALIQELYQLQDLEVDLLELQIARLPETITHDHKEILQQLWDTYCAMTDRQKNSVENYDVLVAAINAEKVYAGIAAYQVGKKLYYGIDVAIEAAAAADKTVTLIANATADEVLLTEGVTLDLNGFTLTVDALTANIVGSADGYVVDSSEGNAGLLAVDRDGILLKDNNPDLPLYDAATKGFRFFDYVLYLHPTTEPVGTASQKFWFKFHFYTNDEGTALDQDAYSLVAADGSNLTISTKLTWKNTVLPQVYFGRNGDTDAFSAEWATGATASRWLYVTVSGLNEVSVGKLSVEPVLTVNNVKVTGGAITYEKKLTSTGGWTDEGPSA